jgi:hypothetical protein
MRPAKYLGAHPSLIDEYLLKPWRIFKSRASAVARPQTFGYMDHMVKPPGQVNLVRAEEDNLKAGRVFGATPALEFRLYAGSCMEPLKVTSVSPDILFQDMGFCM